MEAQEQEELEKHLPEWFLILCKLLTEQDHSLRPHEAAAKMTLAEERDENKRAEVHL